MNRNLFALSQLQTDQLPEHMTYAAKLRAAAAKAVSEEAITEIMQNVVKRAKEGDDKAIRFLFDAVLGANQPVTLKQINHHHGEPQDEPREPNGETRRMMPQPVNRIGNGAKQARPVKAERLGSNKSPLSNSALHTTADIVAYLRVHGPSVIIDAAAEVGIAPRLCRELARQSSDITLDGDMLSLTNTNGD